MEDLIIIKAKDLTVIVKQAMQEVLALNKQTEPNVEQRDLGGIDLACEVTGLSKSTIYKLKMDGKIPVKKVAKKLYFSRSQLTAWIEEGNIKTTNELQAETSASLATRLRKNKR